MNHAEAKRKAKRMSKDALEYTIKDCREAISAMPDNEKNGDYADTIHYCRDELCRRWEEKAESQNV